MSIYAGNHAKCKRCDDLYPVSVLDPATGECRDCKNFDPRDHDDGGMLSSAAQAEQDMVERDMEIETYRWY